MVALVLRSKGLQIRGPSLGGIYSHGSVITLTTTLPLHAAHLQCLILSLRDISKFHRLTPRYVFTIMRYLAACPPFRTPETSSGTARGGVDGECPHSLDDYCQPPDSG
jgi:hypothetical protein